VLKEVWKFINIEMREFKDLDVLNPSRSIQDEEETKKLMEEQTKAYLGIN